MRIFRPNLYRADLPGQTLYARDGAGGEGSKAFVSVGWSMAFQPVKAMTPQSSRIARKNSCDDPHVSFPASEAGSLQATMSSLELTPRVIFFLNQLGWTLIAARGNHPWQVPRDEGCSRFNCRLKSGRSLRHSYFRSTREQDQAGQIRKSNSAPGDAFRRLIDR